MSWFKNDTDGVGNMKDEFFDVVAALPKAAGISNPGAFTAAPPALATRSKLPAELKPVEAAAGARVSPPAATKTPTSILGSTLRFRGELRADEDFTLQGRIEGSIHHTQALTIGTDGVVKGDSKAHTIVVEGTIEGDLYALESINVMATARVTGNIFAPRVAIADGATFNGKIDMASATKAARAIVGRHSAAGLNDSEAEQVLSGT